MQNPENREERRKRSYDGVVLAPVISTFTEPTETLEEPENTEETETMNPMMMRRDRRTRPMPEDYPEDDEDDAAADEPKEEKKTVDYVLVYKKSSIDDESFPKIETFVINLENKGFILDTFPYSINENINFITIHAPHKILLHFADIFRIDVAFQNVDFKPPATIPLKCMATELIIPNPETRVYTYATALFDRDCPPSFTNAEKNLLIYKVLVHNAYGSKKYDNGIHRLIEKNVVETAFPLHDGDFEWPPEDEENINDRQLLLKYWGNFRCWWRQQPLDLVERYFGSEIAFYYAWLGTYNKMLIIASIVGFVCFLLGIFTFRFTFGQRNKEVCNSKKYLCPRCRLPNCKFEFVNNSCIYAELIQFFDNPLTVTFAALMSLWATLFLELWHREETILQMRWNLRRVETDMSMRPQFEEQTKFRTLSPITGKVEPYMPSYVLCYRYVITYSVILLLIVLMALGLFGVMLYVKTVSIILTKTNHDKVVSKNVNLWATVSGSLLSLCFIILFDQAYTRIAIFLTNLENPRTQVDYDNSFTYKSYAMAFINNYSVIFYIAFFKGRFYTYPGDDKLWNTLSGIGTDICDPAGCIIDLGAQLVICLLGKNLIFTVLQFILPKLKRRFFLLRTFKRLVKDGEVDQTRQWEKDYLLNKNNEYDLMAEYMQMVIQYGFVIFFVAAFPLAPMIALFNNAIELRVDAQKMLKENRRSVARKVANVGAWNGILNAVTFFGMTTNAIVISVTSEFVSREVYRYREHYDLEGFMDSQLSAFEISEFNINFTTSIDEKYCYYSGQRYPPANADKYILTTQYWFTFTAKIIAVVALEHLFMLSSGFLSYVIPDIPFSVKEQLNHQRDNFKELRKKVLNDKYLKKRRGTKKDILTGI